MEKLPSEIKLSKHARKRIEERNQTGYKYNTKNLMKSGCKWYGKDDFIVNSPFYLRYIKLCGSSNNRRYITDGNIEVLYNASSNIVITILNVDKIFLPVDKYIRPEILERMMMKKAEKKNKKSIENAYFSQRVSVENININKDYSDFSYDEMALLYKVYS